MQNQLLKFLCAVVLVFAAAACYDDAFIWKAVNTNTTKIEALEKQVNQINQDISDLKIILAALKEKDFVAEVYQLPDDAGYVIIFDSGKSISINNLKDGSDGKTPAISVAKGSDGCWYWTINGSWLLDSQGNKVSAGGADAVTPMLKIEDGCWFISYDSGKTWEKLGNATGEDGGTLFKSLTEDADNIYITMTNGDVFTIPKKKDFRIVINNEDPIKCVPGQKIEVPYSLLNVGKDLEFTTLCEGVWSAKIEKKTAVSGNIVITVPVPYSDGKVVLLACSDGVSSMKILTFEEGYFSTSSDAGQLNMSGDGGTYNVTFTTNLELSFTIWDDCKDWVKEIQTKSGQVTAAITVAANEDSEERVGHISVYYGDLKLSNITLVQAKAPDFVDLGLSVKWRRYNVGATRTHDFGNYFAWGEVTQKDGYYYYWSNYKYCEGTEKSLTKYVTDAQYGTVDDKVILEPEDDAAQVNLGEGWRTPTFEEFQELRDQCNWEWTEDYNRTGIKGRIVRSLVPGYTDRYIFLPAGGCCNDKTSISSLNSNGLYYSSSLHLEANYGADGFVFNNSSSYGEQCHNFDLSRWLGKTIRPVKDFDADEKSIFKLYKSTIAFNPKEQKYAVSLLSNMGAQCDLSQVSGWISLISQRGNTFLFNITKNKTGATRNGNIIFHSDDGSKTCYLSVSQESSSEIDATALNLDFSNTSGTIGGSLYIGSTYKFSVTATPSNATTQYEWKVEDARIATISGNGSSATLSTKDFGHTAVVVVEKNSGLNARYEFGTAVTDFQFTENTGETIYGDPKITMVIGEKHQIEYTCTPSYATRIFSDLSAFNFREIRNGTYMVVDESTVVDVDENGLMTAKGEGKTLIKSNNSHGVYKASGGSDEIYVQVLSEYSEQEPNNDIPYASTLKLGVPVSFYISSTTDVDCFRYSANKTSISFDLTYKGGETGPDKHLKWELYDSSCNLVGSGNLSFSASGDMISMTNKVVGTYAGYFKFYFPTNWYSYPETCPLKKLTIKVY